MEPQASPPPEQAPAGPQPERIPLPDKGEANRPTPEELVPKGETASQSAPPIPPTSLPKPVTVDEEVPATETKKPSVADADTGPAVADDVDVIEKEWVDKAKSIVNEHKHDPYNQEKETSKLQADYIKKRHGKDIKLAS